MNWQRVSVIESTTVVAFANERMASVQCLFVNQEGDEATNCKI